MIPFAHALLRSNDDVIVTAPASAGAMIADAGLDHHPIPDPPDEPRAPIFEKARTLAPDDANALVASDLFVRIDTRLTYPHIRAVVERWEPDVILFDIADFAAGLVAEATGVPAVSVGVSPGIHLQRLALPIAEALDEVRAEIGLDPDPRLERMTATPCFTLDPARARDARHRGVDRAAALPHRGGGAAAAAGLVEQRRVAAGLPHARLGGPDPGPAPSGARRPLGRCPCAC